MVPITTALTAFKATLSPKFKDLISKNKNSNENASTLGKVSVDTVTSPAVPKATAPSVEEKQQGNNRPSPPGISAEGTSPLDQDKVTRAYEHERQRVKRAGDWAKRSARKATKGTIRGTSVGRASAPHAARRVKNGKVGLDVDVDVDAVTPQGRDTEHPTDAGLLVSLSPSGDGGKDASKVVPGVEVNLAEIIMLSQRKPRKPKVEDFEVIPHIRSVIALDDAANVHDMDLDEPWEHIYGEGKVPDGTFGRPSYARVAGTGCQ